MKVLYLLLFFTISSTIYCQKWYPPEGPDAGTIGKVSFSPLNPEIAVASQGTRVYYTSDGGDTWINIFDTNLIYDIAIIDRGILISGYKYFKLSTDLGKTWNSIYDTQLYITSITVHPLDYNLIYAYDDSRGIIKSTNGGESWSIIKANLGGRDERIIVSEADLNTVYLKIRSTLNVSTDQGTSWEERILPANPNDELYGDPCNSSILYSNMSINDTLHYLISTDRGLTWVQKSDSVMWYLIPLKEGDSTVLYGFNGKFNKSYNQGASWEYAGEINYSFNNFYFYKGRFYCTLYKFGIASSTDLKNWELKNKGIRHGSLNDIIFHNGALYALISGMPYRSTDNGINWEILSSVGFKKIVFGPGNIMYAHNSNQVYKSSDFGKTWIQVSNIRYFHDLHDLKVINNNLYTAIEGGEFPLEDCLIRSKDGGVTWESILTGPNFSVISDGSVIYGVYSDYFIPRDTTICKSTDYGNTWQFVHPAKQGVRYSFYSFKDNPKGIFIGGTGNHGWPPYDLIFISGNQVKELTDYISYGINSIVSPKGRKEFFVNQNIDKILKADSIGAPLVDFEDGLVGPFANWEGYSLFYINAPGLENRIFTNRNFFMINDLNSVTGNVKEVDVPLSYSLHQNYPNPFNPTTIIKYSIPEAGKVTIMVYNTLGKEVALVANEYKDRGSYEVNFNATSLPSGVYFYRIQAGRYSETRKMILLK